MKELVGRIRKFIQSYLKYIVLTAVLLVLVISTFIILFKRIEDTKTVAITSAVISIVGGALASVVVAWLIEISNIINENKKKKKAIDCILIDYDVDISFQMQHILVTCAKYQDINIEGSYGISDISSMLEGLEENNLIFKSFFLGFSKVNSQLTSVSILLFDNDHKGIELYKSLEKLKAHIDVANSIINRDNAGVTLKLLTIQSLQIIEKIARIRDMSRLYTIKEESKDYIRKFRK